MPRSVLHQAAMQLVSVHTFNTVFGTFGNSFLPRRACRASQRSGRRGALLCGLPGDCVLDLGCRRQR